MNKKQIVDLVYNYKTKYKEGFTSSEIHYLMCQIGKPIDFKAYTNALGCHTAIKVEDEFLTFHQDILTAISCGLESRDITFAEFD